MSSTKKLTLAALFLALGLIMPFLTGQIPEIGNMLLPMHILVIICGFVCGWRYGLVVGFIVPLLRSVLFGRPYMMPTAVAMAFELASYGVMAGVLYNRFKQTKAGSYISLIGAMIVGRVVWGIVSFVLYRLMGNAFTWELFAAGAFLEAMPGIIVQLILIPVVIVALRKARLME